MNELERIKADIKEKERVYNNAKRDYEKSELALKLFQRKCRHLNAIIGGGWQGGGIYYTYCTCPDCDRSGSRYIPEYHMEKNNEWYNKYSDNQITLERAIEIGKRIGDGLFDADRWWGLVDDYQALLTRSRVNRKEDGTGE